MSWVMAFERDWTEGSVVSAWELLWNPAVRLMHQYLHTLQQAHKCHGTKNNDSFVPPGSVGLDNRLRASRPMAWQCTQMSRHHAFIQHGTLETLSQHLEATPTARLHQI